MEVKLNIFDGSAHCFSKIVHLPCVIGRSRLATISIVHPLVSRQHCEIYEDNGLVMLRDLGSLNGTFYKNIRIGRGVALPYNQVFSIGPLHFVLEPAISDTDKTDKKEPSPDGQREVPQDEKKAKTLPLTEPVSAVDDASTIITEQPFILPVANGSDSSVTELPSFSQLAQPAAENQVKPVKKELPKKPETIAQKPVSAEELKKEEVQTPKDEEKKEDQSTDFDLLWDEMFGK